MTARTIPAPPMKRQKPQEDRDWKDHFGSVYTSSDRPDWQTPDWLFAGLDRQFRFALDAAATDRNHKCDLWLGPGGEYEDALHESVIWREAVTDDPDQPVAVFCNPPYGRSIADWYRKAWEESRRPNTTIAFLVNANTETTYWRDYVWTRAAEVRFVVGRVHYVHPDLPDARSTQTKGSAIVIWRAGVQGPPAVRAVTHRELKEA